MLNLPTIHFFGRHTDLSPTTSNFWYDTAVDDSSIKKYEIPCPKRQVMFIGSVLFVNYLMCYAYSMLF